MAEFYETKLRENILRAIGKEILKKAVRLVPVDEGRLKSHLDYMMLEGNTITVGTSGVDYADTMEYGSPPEKLTTAEKKAVDEWAHRRGLKTGKGVIWKLEHKGIEVGTAKDPLHITSFRRNSYRPFLRPAMYQTKSEIKRIVLEELKKFHEQNKS